ncbi:MAG: 3-hydroxyacyl-CoA dehydrogenase [Candidatus Latescibacteria bacterium]|jgi:3-hydroxyacyl-CoA dehydrogenase|nr:3-hydroxyacyl-CoA dehydrogenase [Candidatus Latescibacterota bacterium]|tara:strand:+ start:98 stop:1084 length:987 start_codon:yes stop_codon:yes gene_type:complete
MAAKASTPGSGAIAVVGGGSIGVAWAIVFARSGRSVQLLEPDEERQRACMPEIRDRLDCLSATGLIEESVDAIAGRVALSDRTELALLGAVHVQECAPENLELKRSIFAELDALALPGTTVASSSSTIPCSAIADDLAGKDRCMVAHPGNPPYLLPIVELVPAPFTSDVTIDRVESLMKSARMSPVRVHSEIEGFVFNRLQGALLREAYCLVRDQIITPRDLDKVVTAGLGRRWSVIGPFATTELNTRGGISTHAQRLGPAYARMGAERGQDDPWTESLVSRVAADIHTELPPELWESHVRRRDQALMALERARRETTPIMHDLELPD